MMDPAKLQQRIERYETQRQVKLVEQLGAGTQGSVFALTDPRQSCRIAIKFHFVEDAYRRERDIYWRLRELGITEVKGFMVPEIVEYDDEFMSIGMTIVSPPFCLDFGGAYLDRPPDYSPEVWADWEEMKSDAFEENWPAVKSILATFESFGVYIADVNPGNIKFD